MDHNDKVKMVCHRDYHRRKLYHSNTYNHLGYNLFTDDRNVSTNDMDHNNKIKMVCLRDYHRRKLYLNL